MAFWSRSRRTSYRIGQPNKVGADRNKLASVGKALVAAGDKVERREAQNLRRLIMPWQIRAFGYYDQLGEIKYASQFYSRMLAPLRLYPAVKDENDEIVALDDADVPDEDKAIARAALARIQDPGGGRTSLLSTYGRLMFLTGEVYLLCTIDPDTKLEQWEMLSTDELRLMDGVYMRYRAPTLMAENYEAAPDDAYEPLTDKQAVVYRLWKRHPRYSSLADATMQGVLDTCEELVLLARKIRGTLRSRMAGPGILFLDESITTEPSEPTPDEDPSEDPFVDDMTEAFTSPIDDEGSAGSVVPMVARVSVPENPNGTKMRVADLVYHLQINDPNQTYPELGMAMQCVERLAIGLDMPAEVLTGLGDINHWGAWQVDEQTWKSHGQPIAQQLCDDLTASYYRLELRDQGVENWQSYVVAYDAAAVINHPDRSKDAKDLFADRAISKKAYREAKGFSDADAMPKEELAESIGIATRDSSLAWFGTPAPRGGAVETAPGVIESATPGAGSGDAQAPTGGDAEPGPPPAGDVPTDTGLGAAAVARVLGAVDLAVLRAREAAGNRILSYAKRDPDVVAELRGVRTSQVAATLGRDRVRELGAPAEIELVAGTRDVLAEVLEYFCVRGTNVAELIGDSVEKHAARTLYDLRPAAIPSQLTNTIRVAAAPPSDGTTRRRRTPAGTRG